MDERRTVAGPDDLTRRRQARRNEWDRTEGLRLIAVWVVLVSLAASVGGLVTLLAERQEHGRRP